MTNQPGTLYIGHFDKPLAHARHYLGWTGRPVEKRWNDHMTGKGSPLVRAALDHGIEITWQNLGTGTRTDERKLHNRKNTRAICPACQAN